MLLDQSVPGQAILHRGKNKNSGDLGCVKCEVRGAGVLSVP